MSCASIFTCIIAMTSNFSKKIIFTELLSDSFSTNETYFLIVMCFYLFIYLFIYLLLTVPFSSFQNQLYFLCSPNNWPKYFICSTIPSYILLNAQVVDTEYPQETCSPISVVEEFCVLFVQLPNF